MKWAFWRRRKPRATGPGRTDARQGGPAVRPDETALDETGVRTDQAAQMRVRMRRRLIGAAALLLGTAVVVPMMLDPAPRPLPDSIPIDIPSERTPFTPRLPQSAMVAPAEARGADPASTAPSGAAAAGRPGEAQGAKGAEPVDEPPAEAPGAEAGGAKAARWMVQAAALSSEGAARQLSERLAKAGVTAFVERTGSGNSVLYRVRVGPFDSREAAVKARRNLHALGVSSNVVRVEQGGR